MSTARYAFWCHCQACQHFYLSAAAAAARALWPAWPPPAALKNTYSSFRWPVCGQLSTQPDKSGGAHSATNQLFKINHAVLRTCLLAATWANAKHVPLTTTVIAQAPLLYLFVFTDHGLSPQVVYCLRQRLLVNDGGLPLITLVGVTRGARAVPLWISIWRAEGIGRACTVARLT